jgi:hypothetical protein
MGKGGAVPQQQSSPTPDAPLEGRRYAVRVLAGSSRNCCVKWRPRGLGGKFYVTSSDPKAVEVTGPSTVEIDSNTLGDSAKITFTLIGKNALPKSTRSVPILIHNEPEPEKSSYRENLVMEVQFVERSRSRSPVRQYDESKEAGGDVVEQEDEGPRSKKSKPAIVPRLGLGGIKKGPDSGNADAHLLNTARFDDTPRDSARGRRPEPRPTTAAQMRAEPPKRASARSTSPPQKAAELGPASDEHTEQLYREIKLAAVALNMSEGDVMKFAMQHEDEHGNIHVDQMHAEIVTKVAESMPHTPPVAPPAAPPLPPRRGTPSPAVSPMVSPRTPRTPRGGEDVEAQIEAHREQQRKQSLDTVFHEILRTKAATVNVMKTAKSAAMVVVAGKVQLDRIDTETKKLGHFIDSQETLQSTLNDVVQHVDGEAQKYDELVSTQRKLQSTLGRVVRQIEGESKKLNAVVENQKSLESKLDQVLVLLAAGAAQSTASRASAAAAASASEATATPATELPTPGNTAKKASSFAKGASTPKKPTAGSKESSAPGQPKVAEEPPTLNMDGLGSPSKTIHPWHDAIKLFEKLDRHKTGKVSQLDMLKALRKDRAVAETLGLPSVIHQEDGSRDAFERLFQSIDADNDKYVTRADIFRAVRDNVVKSPAKTPRQGSRDSHPTTPVKTPTNAATADASADASAESDGEFPPPWLPNSWTKISEDKRLGTVVSAADYEVSFDLRILGAVDDFSSILRFARGNVDDLENDDRSPAFFFPPGSTSLRVYTATEKRPKHLQKMDVELPIGKEIAVRLRVFGGICELYIDRERVIHDQKMDERADGETLVCMASSNHFASANAEVRNVHYYPAPRSRLQGQRSFG